MKTSINEKREFLLQWLNDKSFTSSWDWAIDVEYGEKFHGIDATSIDSVGYMLINSHAPHAIRMAVHKQEYSKVKQDRLKVLNSLAKQGLVIAGWSGLGYAGRADFGLTRVRNYVITEDGRVELKVLKGERELREKKNNS